MRALLAVALGGAVGSVLRYAVGVALLRPGGAGLPWGTFAVNVTFVQATELPGEAPALPAALGGATTEVSGTASVESAASMRVSNR